MKDLDQHMTTMNQVQRVCITLMKLPVPVPVTGMMKAMTVSSAQF